MRAYLGERDHTGQDLEASVHDQRQSLANTALEEGLKPCTRWKMVAREGSVWTSWRPRKLASSLGYKYFTGSDYVPALSDHG